MKATVLQCIRLHKAYLINIELSMQSADWFELQTQLTHAQHNRSWGLLQSRNKHTWTYVAHLQSQTAGPLDKSDQSSAFAHRQEVCSAQTRTRGVQIRKWSDKNKGCLTSQSWPWAEQRGLNIKSCGFLRLASAALHRSPTISLNYCCSPLSSETSRKRKLHARVKLNKYSSVSLHTK